MTIDGELRQLLEIFSEAKRNGFWVVEGQNKNGPNTIVDVLKIAVSRPAGRCTD
jgi:hypothetical protein